MIIIIIIIVVVVVVAVVVLISSLLLSSMHDFNISSSVCLFFLPEIGTQGVKEALRTQLDEAHGTAIAVEEDRDRTQRTLRRLESEAAAQALEHAQYSEEAEATKQRFVPPRQASPRDSYACIFFFSLSLSVGFASLPPSLPLSLSVTNGPPWFTIVMMMMMMTTLMILLVICVTFSLRVSHSFAHRMTPLVTRPRASEG